MLIAASDRGSKHVSQHDDLTVCVGNLDTDRGLPRDGREDPHISACYCVGNVLGQRRDALDLGAGTQLHLVPGDRWSTRKAGDRCVNTELRQHVGQRLNDSIVGGAALLMRRALDQGHLVRKHIGKRRIQHRLLGRPGENLSGRSRKEELFRDGFRLIDRVRKFTAAGLGYLGDRRDRNRPRHPGDGLGSHPNHLDGVVVLLHDVCSLVGTFHRLQPWWGASTTAGKGRSGRLVCDGSFLRAVILAVAVIVGIRVIVMSVASLRIDLSPGQSGKP